VRCNSREVAPGVGRNGRPYETCCKECALGKGHSAECDARVRRVSPRGSGGSASASAPALPGLPTSSVLASNVVGDDDGDMASLRLVGRPASDEPAAGDAKDGDKNAEHGGRGALARFKGKFAPKGPRKVVPSVGPVHRAIAWTVGGISAKDSDYVGPPPTKTQKLLRLRYKDLCPRSGLVCLCCCSSILVFFMMFAVAICGAFRQLGQFKFGLVRNKWNGIVDLDTVYTPGRYFIGVWRDFLEFPSTLQTIEFSREAPEDGVMFLSPLKCRDMVGNQAFIHVAVQFQLRPETLGKLYYEMKMAYEDILIAELRAALLETANSFRINRMWEDFSSIQTMMFDSCKRVLSKRYVECWGLQLGEVYLDPKWEKKLVATQVMKQKARTIQASKAAAEIRAETLVVMAAYTRQITEIKAAGDAGVINITQSAVAEAAYKRALVDADILSEVQNETAGTGLDKLNGSRLMDYERYLMLRDMDNQTWIYNSFTGALGPWNGNTSEKLAYQAAGSWTDYRGDKGRPQRRLLLRNPDRVGHEL